MTSRFRSGFVVPAHLRPQRSRRAARVVVRAGEQVLLMRDSDPGVPGSCWWVTPGGGVDDGESWHQAALREVREETGLELQPEELLGPIAGRVVRHGYSDQILTQTEQFFIADVELFEPNLSGFTEDEKVTLSAATWFSADQLAELTVWPQELASLLAWQGGYVDLGEIEESTVPI